MTVVEIKEDLFNRFGWRLSDREHMILTATQNGETELYEHMTLSEREEYLIRLAKG